MATMQREWFREVADGSEGCWCNPKPTVLHDSDLELIDLGGIAEALGDHGVEGAEVFFFAFGEAAVDLHEGEEAGAAEIDGGNGCDAAGILGHLPGAGIALAKHLAEVAAPEADFEIDVELGAFADQDEDFVECVNGFSGEVLAPAVTSSLPAGKQRRPAIDHAGVLG